MKPILCALALILACLLLNACTTAQPASKEESKANAELFGLLNS